MKHQMKLWQNSFASVKSGLKTIEMRLRDEKRSQIKTGDTIEFLNVDTKETLLCEVTDIYLYDTFEELYRRHDKISLGYAENETADPEDMLAYYPQEKIDRYGVMGIGVKAL